MKGTYRFYQQGELIAVSHNVITTAGKQIILRYLAGQTNAFGGSLAVGSSGLAVTEDDARLTMEFERATISLSSVDLINSRVLFKTTLSQNMLGMIREVGMYSSPYGATSNGFPSRLIATFDSQTEAWTGGTFQTTPSRIGPTALRASSTDGAVSSLVLDTNLDLSGYSPEDELLLAADYSVVPTSIAIRLRGIDPATYYEALIPSATIGTGAGYKVLSPTLGSFTKTANIDLSSIRSIEIRVTWGAAGTIDFDGIRIEDMTVDNPNHILVSHSTLATPKIKDGLAPVDVEYGVTVGLV